MLSHEQSPLAHTSYFGIDIMRSTPEVANLPPVESAAQTLARAVREGDGNQIVAIETAERHLGKILTVTEDRDGIDMHLTDLFTADQLHEMIRRVTTYLGKSLDAHIEEPGRPTGFDFYVKRLGFHFGSGDDDVFGSEALLLKADSDVAHLELLRHLLPFITGDVIGTTRDRRPCPTPPSATRRGTPGEAGTGLRNCRASA